MKIEKLDSVLAESKVKNIEVSSIGNETFERCRKFLVANQEFTIVWHVNYCKLVIGELIVSFDYLDVSNTYPSGANMNLQFYLNGRNNCVAVIKLEN